MILDVVAKSGRDVDIADAIVGGELERTIEGASTLTLEVHDPHRTLIRAPDLRRAIDFKYAGVWFRLVKVAKSGDTVTLTFEDRDVAYLRSHTRPRKVSRGSYTRAQFVRLLVREVKANRIKFYCPEVNEKQPIGSLSQNAKPTKRNAKDREEKRQKGLTAGALVTVKGQRATADQRRNAERCLDVADTLKAGPKATKALMVAVTQESGIQNLTYGHSSSVGILQLLDIHGPVSVRRDIEHCVRLFLTKGFTGKGGAMQLARDNPGMDAADIAAAVQGNAAGSRDYRPWSDEADKWIENYGGASGTDTGGASADSGTRRRYEFSRGQAGGEREDSWTAIQRLASEVQWRAFMDKGTLYFMSENRLMESRARYILSEDSDGVHYIDFDVDQGRIDAEVRVSCSTELFDMRVGSVVAIRNMGIANGRWLVSTVRQSLFDNDAEVTLKAPTPKLAEPDTELTTGKTASQGDSATSGSLRDRIIKQAEKTLTKTTGFNRYSQAGALTDDPTPAAPARTDCSQWVRAVYLRAGAKDPGTYTGAMIAKGTRTSEPKPGDLLVGPAHVELFVSGDKTYGHGSPPIDEGSVAYHRGRGLFFVTFDFLDD